MNNLCEVELIESDSWDAERRAASSNSALKSSRDVEVGREKRYSCEQCNYKSDIQAHVVRHSRTHVDLKLYACDICDYRGKEESLLLRHKLRHSGDKPHKCPHCDYSCMQRGTLKAHMWNHTGKKPYACVECDYTCTRSCHLKIHLRKHENPHVYGCSACSYKGATFEAILSHGADSGHSDFTPTCAICPFVSPSAAVLVDHVARHLSIKEFKCSVCPYTSTAACILRRHERTHTGEKPYECDACDYRCTDAGLLKRHKRIHTGEKPFSCAICGYRSSQTSTLQSHMWTHNGQKPFGCSFCDYRCNRASNLRTHMWKHDGHKLFPCPDCPFKCTTAGNLKTHVNRKHRRGSEGPSNLNQLGSDGSSDQSQMEESCNKQLAMETSCDENDQSEKEESSNLKCQSGPEWPSVLIKIEEPHAQQPVSSGDWEQRPATETSCDQKHQRGMEHLGSDESSDQSQMEESCNKQLAMETSCDENDQSEKEESSNLKCQSGPEWPSVLIKIEEPHAQQPVSGGDWEQRPATETSCDQKHQRGMEESTVLKP